MIKLKGITWNHSRGYNSVVATAQRYMELHENISIEWEKRSLQEFADKPIHDLANHYDFLVIDHPWAGYASKTGILLPLEKYLPRDYLQNQKENSVGLSHDSYCFDGFQSALAIDAATPIAVYRQDYFEKEKNIVPETWEDVIKLAKDKKVIYAGIPINLLMDFYMFCVTLGGNLFNGEKVIDDITGSNALELMKEIATLCPKEIFNFDPINVHEYLAKNDDKVYCPFAYGYSNYSREGYGDNILIAGDTVSLNKIPLKTVLGGTGIAISSFCKEKEIAADYALYTASEKIQKTIFFDNGGQPGHRSAWIDPEVNRRCNNFFKNTLKTLDNSYLRPRYDGYLEFQDKAGDEIQKYVKGETDKKSTLEKLNALYKNSLKE